MRRGRDRGAPRGASMSSSRIDSCPEPSSESDTSYSRAGSILAPIAPTTCASGLRSRIRASMRATSAARRSSGIWSSLLTTISDAAPYLARGTPPRSTTSKCVTASMTSTTPPGRTRSTPLKRISRDTATGSASPLASTTIASRARRGSDSFSSASSSPLSSSRQQTQPPAMETGSSTWPVTRAASTLTSPKSLMTTPIRAPGARSTWLSRLVLPAPRYPVNAMTGMARTRGV